MRRRKRPLPGPVRLARFLETTGLSQAEAARTAAKLAGERVIHRSHFCHWLAGRRTPTLEQAVALECLTTTWPEGPIRPSEWVTIKALTAA
jgi:hypothetical protein